MILWHPTMPIFMCFVLILSLSFFLTFFFIGFKCYIKIKGRKKNVQSEKNGVFASWVPCRVFYLFLRDVVQ
jgi:hypothetical protein